MSWETIHPPALRRARRRPNWPLLAGVAGAIALSALLWAAIAIALLRA